ncbi:MAG: hypothetical protein PHO15_10585 [Eubacteriales bacterium]|nr:hypothetical protein [Eubacteriales bacterium]
MDVPTLIVSIIGACAWIPILITLLRKNRILGSIIDYDLVNMVDTSYRDKDGTTRTISGGYLVLGLSIFVTKNVFIFNDMEVKIVLSNGSMIEGKLVSTVLNLNEPDGSHSTFDIPIEYDLLCNKIFKSNAVNNFCLRILLEGHKISTPNEIEKIVLYFIKTKRNRKRLTFTKKDIPDGLSQSAKYLGRFYTQKNP